MPYLKIETNVELAPDQRQQLLSESSRRAAELLGKPERYVMVSLTDGHPMLFGGTDAPLVYMEFKSIGLPESQTAELSSALAALMTDRLGVPADRVYIEFANAARHLWGWNGATF